MSAPPASAERLAQRKEDKMDSPTDYLGISYQLYCNEIYSLSISQPTKYYTLRNNLLKNLNEVLLTNTHNVIFDILRYGKIGEDSFTNGINPSYPAELCNKISMDISKAYQIEVQKIIRILLPPDSDSLAKSSMSTKTLANSIDRVTPIVATPTPTTTA